jgi:hypothetical protein
MRCGVEDLATVARAIIDESVYVVLGTADEHGMPWVSPVYFGSDGYLEFYWVSSPEVLHSRNIARRPQISMVVFDSRQPPGTGRAVYLDAVAGEVGDDELDPGLEVYNRRSVERAELGLRRFGREQVTGAAAYRLWRATVSRSFAMCPREAGKPCVEHGAMFDHRTEITL